MKNSNQSSDPDQTLAPANDELTKSISVATLRDQLRLALLGVLSLTLLTGALFPLMLFVLARPMFPTQAKGSLVARDGIVIGSELIGQNFTSPPTSSRDLRPRARDTTRLLQAAPISARKTGVHCG